MEPVLVSCLDCEARVRVRRPELLKERRCPRCGAALPAINPPLPTDTAEPDHKPGARPVWWRRARVGALTALAIFLGAHAIRHAVSPEGTSGAGAPSRSIAGPVPALSHDDPTKPPLAAPPPPPTVRAQLIPVPSTSSPLFDSDPNAPPRPPLPPRPEAVLPAAEATPEAPLPEPKRIRVRTRTGQTVTARVHGGEGGNTHVVLPDGQLGVPDNLAYTDEPFRPATASEIAADLTSGPFAGFEVKLTPHYVVLSKATPAFTEASAEVLENLYKGLAEAFRKREFPVVEAEFPLVAVIFRTEREFRAHKSVAPEVQAYYEIYTNRIYFYEASERDAQAPEVAALRRPQTVAHEGTHQILQNIGIHPRLASWPPWLVEGLAEYCGTPATTKKGTNWSGIGVPNAQHLATIRDLNDPLSGQVPGAGRPEHIGRPPEMPLVEYLVKKSDLTPTDYALAWAMTHFLGMKRVDEFVSFLKTMSELPPLVEKSPEHHLIAFREAFGENLPKLDREIGTYLAKLKTKDVLPYYAVLFQQRVPGGLVKRALVSQSPSTIQQWLGSVTDRGGEPPVWEPRKHPNRTRAWVTAQQWMQGF